MEPTAPPDVANASSQGPSSPAGAETNRLGFLSVTHHRQACLCPVTFLQLQSWRHSLPAVLYGSPHLTHLWPTISSGDAYYFSPENTLPMPPAMAPCAPLHTQWLHTEEAFPVHPPWLPIISVRPRSCLHCWDTAGSHRPLWLSSPTTICASLEPHTWELGRQSALRTSTAPHCPQLGSRHPHFGTEELSSSRPPQRPLPPPIYAPSYPTASAPQFLHGCTSSLPFWAPLVPTA